MYSKKQLLILIAFLTMYNPCTDGQNLLYQVTNVSVKNGNKNLTNAWVGGLNNPQFSAVNFDSSGYTDLFIFDKSGSKVLTFTNNGTPGNPSYRYSPQYEYLFPKISRWALLRDINCDGIADLVTHDNLGIKAYRGSFHNGFIKFTLINPLVTYESINGSDTNYINVFVPSDDIPGIVDVDGDGDTDILTFGLFGNSVKFYKNRSMELTGSCGFKDFVWEDDCWGNFQEASLTNDILLNSCKGGLSNVQGGNRHVGSTICTPDFDNDGDIDIILGDITFNNLVSVENLGNNISASMGNIDSTFPQYDIPVNIPIFPAAFNLDIDNDGKKDIVVSPNSTSASISQANVWYYKNIGSAGNTVYEFQTDSFLIASIVDKGQNSNVSFLNYNQDSLMDIVIGNYGYYQLGGNASSSLTLLENTGSKKNPSFRVVTDDFAKLKQYNLYSIKPAFGDIDGDEDIDMIIGEENGVLHFFKNTAGPGAKVEFLLASSNYMGIDVGQFSTPFIYDVNGDLLPDLLIGDKTGEIHYYQNTGTPLIPSFSDSVYNPFFGEIDVSEAGSVTGYSDPFIVLDSAGMKQIYIGSQSGRVFQYEIKESDSLLSGPFTLINDYVGSIDVGENSTVAIADLNDDNKMEFLVGNTRGGVNFYSETIWDSAVIIPPIDTTDTSDTSRIIEIRGDLIKVSPNPTTGFILVESEFPALKTVLFNTLGRKVEELDIQSKQTSFTLDLGDQPPGVYLMQIYFETRIATVKIFIR